MENILQLTESRVASGKRNFPSHCSWRSRKSLGTAANTRGCLWRRAAERAGAAVSPNSVLWSNPRRDPSSGEKKHALLLPMLSLFLVFLPFLCSMETAAEEG